MHRATYPAGIPYIIGNEAAERFSYYGMKCILVVFMTKYLQDASGASATMSEADAKVWFHLFSTANYFFPILGALIADVFWGKYKTIINLSLVYCLGHLALAIDDTHTGLAIGLTLIAIGSGGIKPCVSAHVGDQFRKENASLVERTFSYFYLSINLGAFISTLLTPLLLEWYGPSVAFGIPGLLMLLATIVFWMGRESFVSIPASGWAEFKAEVFGEDGRRALIHLCGLYVFISLFWGLFDQTGSAWVLQASRMDTSVSLFGYTFSVLPAQLQALNPILILVLVPLFTFFVYPFTERLVKLTPLRKIGVGFVLSAASFGIIAYAEGLFETQESVSIIYQVYAYIVLTASEVLISITALEFSYTQAPARMKSIIMGLFFLSVSLGNLVTALINSLIGIPLLESHLTGASYFQFFAWLMVLNFAIFLPFACRYRGRVYLHS